GEARACRDRSKEVLQNYDDLVTRFGHHARYIRADLPRMKATYDAQSALWKQIAEVYEHGDAAAAQKLQVKAEAGGADCILWGDRLEARDKEAQAAPSETRYIDMNHKAGPRTRAALGALMEAKKDAADAWCSLAEATVPGADREALAGLREKAIA